MDIPNYKSKSDVETAIKGLVHYCYRMINSKIPTIAWVNGHAFAGGWFIALAHHYRIMNLDRGWMCLNEIDLKVPIPTCLSTMGVQKIGTHNYWEAATMGNRYNASESMSKGICNKAFSGTEIIDKTEEFAESIASKKIDPVAFHMMNQDIYKDSLTELKSGFINDLASERIFNIKLK